MRNPEHSAMIAAGYSSMAANAVLEGRITEAVTLAAIAILYGLESVNSRHPFPSESLPSQKEENLP